MCRFACYLGPSILLSDFIIKPTHSIIYQSFGCKERSTPLNGDGFGIAWYAPEIRKSPGVFRAITPAWSNRNLISLCNVTKSPCILAHVRAATQGLAVSEANCHPFHFENLSFVHNGEIACFRKLKRQITQLISEESFLHIEGSTDSEHLFALFLDQYKKRVTENDPMPLVNATKDLILLVQGLVAPFSDINDTTLNIAITDGTEVICTRYSTGKALSLYYCPKMVFDKGTTSWRQSVDELVISGTVIASEPLSQDRSQWNEIPRNHMLHVTKDGHCNLYPLE